MDSNSHDSGQNSRSGKRQQTFMFIDSTTQGANMKPNKAVRSFVMHHARKSRPWSTKKAGQSSNTGRVAKTGPRRSSTQTQHRAGEISAAGTSLLKYEPSSKERNTQSTGSPVSNSSQPCVTPPSSPECACSLQNCQGESCGHAHALTRRDGFALGVLDPFDCLAVPTNAKTSALIDHFANIISPCLIPVDMHQSSKIATTDWLSNALRDTTSGAPFTYAVLTTSALHLQSLGVNNNIENILYYKARAISEINTNLSDPRTSIGDNNIAAVFMLLCLEESQLAPGRAHDDSEWNEMQRAIHLNGLRTMIQQRGGLSALSANRCLQVFILMHSIAHSIASFQRPYTTLLDGNGSPHKYDLPSYRSRPASGRILRQFRALNLDAGLLEIISNVVVFIGDIGAWFEDRCCPLDPLELQKHACLLMYRVFDWYSKEGVERNSLDQCICLGVLIFLVRTSQPHGHSYRAMILTAVRKLREALKKTNIFRWAKSPDLFLWTLTMGALAAQGSTEWGFFAQYCSVTFADAGFDEKTTTEELLQKMKKCLWIPSLLDKDVGKLWLQIGLTTNDETVDEEEEVEMVNLEVKDDDAVGMLTSNRFFSKKSIS
ncbi:hypothetical protein K469DRAFT_656147 [Zopfia rhizophila CBS 207.26]|uniref:Transcription factor domain-containing protein n=1 Tax=Zopfia rhizophila CBS 207.26 TaxID=1314779 RepID=A0A6A6EI33_9PEZI|nr:hypothetical protein K469DRAFT_656147 [Zopfia rhizophila CBS 207.26]